MVTLAHVLAPWGIKGFVKLRLYTEYIDSILQYPFIFLIKKNVNIGQHTIVNHVVKHDTIYVQFSNIKDRDQADLLKSCAVCVEHDQLIELPVGQFYWHDIIGFTVLNKQGVVLGQFVRLFNASVNEVLEIETEQKKTILIPFVPNVFIKEIDTEHKSIVVDWQPNW